MKQKLFEMRIVLLACVLACVPGTTRGVEGRKPNVIIIFTDDQGTIDANCFGANDLVTPGIDSLAARGVRFTQFYAGAPVCSPSRATLLTGRYPVRAGVPGNAGSVPPHLREPGKGDSPGLASEQVTIAETLKAAGYTTAHIGKWHLGYGEGRVPNHQGFDHWFGHLNGCIDNFSHFFYWAGPNRHDLWRNGKRIQAAGSFFPDLMVEEAERFIESNKDQPFFIYFALNCPHYPYQGDAKWLTHYRDSPYPRNLYAAFVSTLDERIRQLLAIVEMAGLRENTIVVFQSDHGHSTEPRAHGGGGSAGPYRGAKFSLFEGGIRVPAIISWPGHLPQGEVRAQLAHGCDWLPTIAELCGAKLLEADIDGKSLAGVIKSENAPSPHKVVHWKTGGQWAVREGDWKLIGNPKDTSNKGELGKEDKLFLANLAEDETEMTNLAAKHPDQVKHLKRLHDEWEKTLRKN